VRGGFPEAMARGGERLPFGERLEAWPLAMRWTELPRATPTSPPPAAARPFYPPGQYQYLMQDYINGHERIEGIEFYEALNDGR
jgi:hypothetical protein